MASKKEEKHFKKLVELFQKREWNIFAYSSLCLERNEKRTQRTNERSSRRRRKKKWSRNSACATTTMMMMRWIFSKNIQQVSCYKRKNFYFLFYFAFIILTNLSRDLTRKFSPIFLWHFDVSSLRKICGKSGIFAFSSFLMFIFYCYNIFALN